jgi:hypothetical protein
MPSTGVAPPAAAVDESATSGLVCNKMDKNI